jgi:hypothetical protein
MPNIFSHASRPNYAPSSGRTFAFVLVGIFLIVFNSNARAQLMINKGATTSTKLNSYVQVNGAYQNQTGTIDDSGIVTITSDFTNNAPAFAGGSGWYNIAGNFTNDGTFTRKTGTVNLNGATNQNVGGAVVTTFYDLQFTVGGTKTLTQKEIVDSNCYFTNGICYTTQPDVLNFTINGNWVNNSGMPVSSCISYVDGPCEKDMNSTNLFWFPVGKDGRANTCAITPSSSTATTFRTQYFDFKYWNTIDIQAPLITVSKVQYWHGDIVTPATGGTNAIIRLYWIPGDYTSASYMSTPSGLVVGRWDTLAPNPPGPTPAWVTAGVSALSPGASYLSGWIESATVLSSQYGTSITNRPFTLASITANNSLPVELGTFTVHQQHDAALLDWKTYSEIESLGFEIERSRIAETGGQVDAPVLIQSFAQDTNLLAKSPWGASYETADEGLASGHYRYDLYEVDRDGIRTKLASRELDFNEISIPNTLQVSIYPNPSAQVAHVEIDVPADAHVTADLYDITGKLTERIEDDEVLAGPHLKAVDVSKLPAGTYNLVVISGTSRLAKSIVVSK